MAKKGDLIKHGCVGKKRDLVIPRLSLGTDINFRFKWKKS
jgi:hypothetical protein